MRSVESQEKVRNVSTRLPEANTSRTILDNEERDDKFSPDDMMEFSHGISCLCCSIPTAIKVSFCYTSTSCFCYFIIFIWMASALSMIKEDKQNLVMPDARDIFFPKSEFSSTLGAYYKTEIFTDFIDEVNEIGTEQGVNKQISTKLIKTLREQLLNWIIFSIIMMIVFQFMRIFIILNFMPIISR